MGGGTTSAASSRVDPLVGGENGFSGQKQANPPLDRFGHFFYEEVVKSGQKGYTLFFTGPPAHSVWALSLGAHPLGQLDVQVHKCCGAGTLR